MAKSNENEMAFFFAVDSATVSRFRDMKKYLMITQSECYSNTSTGLRITNRVRRTELCGEGSGEVIFEAATKYALPPKGGTARRVELEKAITQDEYEMTLPFGEKIYQKRRFVFKIDGLDADLDWYFEKESQDFGAFCKLDINTPAEGLPKGRVIALLKALPSHGIVIQDLVNPPWLFSDGVKQRIDQLMNAQWNLAAV